jgi:hypothetical protein
VVILKAKDTGGVERELLATEDPENPGFYALKTDTEIHAHISGATFVIDNVKVGATGQTTGSTRFLRTADDGTVYMEKVVAASTLLFISGGIEFGLSGSWFSGSSWASCDEYTSGRVYVNYGFSGSASPGANTLYLKLLTTRDTSDSREYDEPQLVVTAGQSDLQQNVYQLTPRTWDNTTASFHGYKEYNTYFDIDLNGTRGFRFAISESIGAGSTTGTLALNCLLTNE